MMKKKIRKYYEAWILRQQGYKLREIATKMGFKSVGNARRMVAYINFRIKSNQLKSKELRALIRKFINNN